MQRGFTLIELMIVVAIIAILVAIALPAYQVFTIRARVAELAVAGSAMKTTIAENIANNAGQLPLNACAGVGITAATTNMASIACDPANGAITVTGTPLALNTVLTFSPDLGGPNSSVGTTWTCVASGSSDRYYPPDCRS